QEVAARLAEGVPVPDLLAGIHRSLADRVARMVRRLKVEKEVILTGGGGKNRGLVKALSEQLGCDLLVPSEPLITGALGAALLGKDMVDKARRTNSPLETKKRAFEAIELL
ncbi:MAG: FGGY-family carbohydrate kinase, partial [Desulfobacterales bacterium]|nr:FGGY-family carbohydrate kinase [Desulfobacterales bacterium]